jgi:outer membrane protein assembly factor BamB
MDRIFFIFSDKFMFMPATRILVLVSFFVPWILFDTLRPLQKRFLLPRWMPICLLVISILNFIDTNYVGIEKQMTRSIVCVDRISGKLNWITEALNGPQPPLFQNSPASPTPVVDSNHVYAWFGSAGIMCSDHKGNLVWTKKNLPYEGLHGVGSSPVPCNGSLIVEYGTKDNAYLSALNCHTGDLVWTVQLPKWEAVWGRHRTPLITKIGNKNVVIIWGFPNLPLTAFDANDGKEICHYDIKGKFIGENVSTIVHDNKNLYLPSKSCIIAVDISKFLNREDPIVWTTNLKNKGPNTTTPIVANDMIFMISDSGSAHCLECKTGKILWSEKIMSCYVQSSPIVVNEKIYFSDTLGNTIIVSAEPKFKQIAINNIKEPIYASLVPLDGEIMIRTTKHLWRFAERKN